MKKLFLPFLIISALTSCVTRQKCEMKFPPEEKVVTKDTFIYKEVVKYRDTTIIIPGKTVTIEKEVNCDSLKRAQLPKTTVKSGNLNATVEIKDGKLKVDCKADSLEQVIKLKEKTISELQKSSTVKETIWDVYQVHWYDTFCRWYFIITATFITLWIYFKRRRLRQS